MEPNEKIAQSLTAARKKAGFRSAREFAESVKMTPSTYMGYENGRRKLTVENACLFADALGISLDALVGRDFESNFKSPKEQDLIAHYRCCTQARKISLLTTAADMAAMSKEDKPTFPLYTKEV